MFVIFGLGPTKTQTKVDYSTTGCFHCNNTRNWIKTKQTLWFSLFFIPLIPVNTTYTHVCPICSNGNKISRQEFEKA